MSYFCCAPDLRISRLLVPGGVQGQVGWVAGHPHLLSDMEAGGPACDRGVGA